MLLSSFGRIFKSFWRSFTHMETRNVEEGSTISVLGQSRGPLSYPRPPVVMPCFFACLFVCLSVCLSVCLFLFCFTSCSRIFPFAITDEWLQDLGPFLGAQGFWAGRDLYRTTSAVTQDLDFPGLSRRYTFNLVAFYDMPEICSIRSYPHTHITRKCMTLTFQDERLKKWIRTFTIFIPSICHLWGSNSLGVECSTPVSAMIILCWEVSCRTLIEILNGRLSMK